MKMSDFLGGRGRGLEATVIASQRGVVRLVKLPTGCKWVGRKIIPMKGPVDYCGVVCATGRAIFFDAKESQNKTSFSLHPSHCPAHQIEFLRLMGINGAIAGLLIESKESERYFWLPFEKREYGPLYGSTVRWTDPRLIDLGDSRMAIKFENIPGVHKSGREAA